jgi:hypothetical protein
MRIKIYNYYKCKGTYHVRKSTASKRTPHASHSNHPECSVGRGDFCPVLLTVYKNECYQSFVTDDAARDIIIIIIIFIANKTLAGKAIQYNTT